MCVSLYHSVLKYNQEPLSKFLLAKWEHNRSGVLYNWFFTPAARFLHSYLNPYGERTIQAIGHVDPKFPSCLHHWATDLNAIWGMRAARGTEQKEICFKFDAFSLLMHLAAWSHSPFFIVLIFLKHIARSRGCILLKDPCFPSPYFIVSMLFWCKERITWQPIILFCSVSHLCLLLTHRIPLVPFHPSLTAMPITASFLLQYLSRESPSGICSLSMYCREQMTSCKQEKGNKEN